MDSSPIWMLGKKHECTSSTKERDDTTTLTSIEQKKDSFPSFVSDFESRIWCTYRKDFPVIPGSFYTSDMGWGCMHRTAQMTLAQAFLSHYLGRGLYLYYYYYYYYYYLNILILIEFILKQIGNFRNIRMIFQRYIMRFFNGFLMTNNPLILYIIYQ